MAFRYQMVYGIKLLDYKPAISFAMSDIKFIKFPMWCWRPALHNYIMHLDILSILYDIIFGIGLNRVKFISGIKITNDRREYIYD